MRIGMLGPFEVRGGDGVPVEVPGVRLRALLIALALEAGRVVPKSVLVDWVWGEQPPMGADNALQRLVSRLRKVVPEGAVEGRSGGYRLVVEPEGVDAVRFERLVARARGEAGAERVRVLGEALALWRGPAMADVVVRGSAAFAAAATRLERLRLSAVEDVFEARLELGQGAGLVSELTELVAAHPLRERLVGALMRALAGAGRDTEALLLFQRTREALAEALGADPSPELSELHVLLLRGELGTPREPVGHTRTNLRAELTSYVGKADDVAAVRGLVGRHRLTTLLGPGGSGKTRLATETARTLVGEFPDGVRVVELAAIGADGDVPQAALAGLGLRDELLGGTSQLDLTERLVSAMRDRRALLVLDNCEHVIEQAARFADRLLGGCRQLRILATSREGLGITGEALWPVEPLALPEPDADPDQITASPAVQLLRARAGAVRADLEFDARTLNTMGRICRALDGMPLAIELAAARLRTMSVDQLADRLHDRFRLLTGGSRTALPRHRTLWAVVDWSWELLSAAEREVLCRLSVFSGGASLDAAEQVCAAGGTAQDTTRNTAPEQVLDLLTSLVEKSLLSCEGEGDTAPRYRMLGTIREYAAQRLTEAGAAEPARRAHLAYFTELTETAEPHLRRAEQLEWLAVLEADHDNIVAAMRGALAAGDAAGSMRLAAGAGWYWWLGGHRSEGIELIMAATRTTGEVPDPTRALVYGLVVHFLSSGRGDERLSEEWIRRAHRFSQASRHAPDRHPLLGLVPAMELLLREPDSVLPAFESLLDDEDPWVRALARLQLGKMRVRTGRGAQDVDAHLGKALAEFRALGERFGISFALTELADRMAMRGDFAGACEHYEQAVGALSEVGAVEEVIRLRAHQAKLHWLLDDKEASAAAIASAQRSAEGVTWPYALAEIALARAELARWAGDTREARHQLDTAVALLGREAEEPHIRALVHDLRGYLTDDLDQARSHRAAALEALLEAPDAPLIGAHLIGMADLSLRQDRHEQAARLLAASADVRGLPDRSHPDLARIEQVVRLHLGETRFTELTQQSAQTPWPDLAAAALAPDP